jgi:outer membrane protein OmpU
MKKVLFATTALVATAGVAAADVSISGSAEMGLVGNGRTVDGVEAQLNNTFHQSVDVRFSMSGTTDNGLTFGAVIDLEDATEQANNVDAAGVFADQTVFISGDFGRLTMGDTDGALDFALTEVGAVGSIADNETGHAGYNGNAGLDGFYQGQVLRYDYAIDGFRFAVSAELDNNGDTDAASGSTAVARQFDDAVVGIGVAYSMDLGGGSFGVGAGYQSVGGDADAFGLSANYAVSGLTFGVSMMQWGDTPIEVDSVGQNNAGAISFLEAGNANTNHTALLADIDHIGLGVTYEMGAFAVHANFGEYEVTSAGGSATTANYDASGYGLAASYDLGGGASLHAGYGNGERSGTIGGTAFKNEYDSFSLGLSMSF